MEWMIPGTVLKVPLEDAEHIPAMFSSMFLAGDVALGQIANITGLEPYVVQNWVKRGFLVPPKNKRYTIDQLCRILNITMLRSVLSIEQICSLLQYVNGHLNDASDDTIRDSQLYFLFVRLAAYHRTMQDQEGREEILEKLLETYEEPVPGARERVGKVLRIMLTAWAASQLRQAAETLCKELTL